MRAKLANARAPPLLHGSGSGSQTSWKSAMPACGDVEAWDVCGAAYALPSHDSTPIACSPLAVSQPPQSRVEGRGTRL